MASLVALLLVTTRDLHVLTTSRAPLGLSAEQVVTLRQLTDDASALFVQRARAARADVDLPADAVADVVARLDGLPLAIELAAARMRTMSVEEVRRRLGDLFDLLRTRDRSAPERHRTLAAVIEWSGDLLDPGAQEAMARLSVFHDGFTRGHRRRRARRRRRRPGRDAGGAVAGDRRRGRRLDPVPDARDGPRVRRRPAQRRRPAPGCAEPAGRVGDQPGRPRRCRACSGPTRSPPSASWAPRRTTSPTCSAALFGTAAASCSRSCSPALVRSGRSPATTRACSPSPTGPRRPWPTGTRPRSCATPRRSWSRGWWCTELDATSLHRHPGGQPGAVGRAAASVGEGRAHAVRARGRARGPASARGWPRWPRTATP